MQISRINTFSTINYYRNQNKQNVQTNTFNKAMSSDSVSFSGISNAPSAITPTLADKIINLFDILHSNEVLLVGKSFNQAVKDLRSHIDTIPTLKKQSYSPFQKVIKKIFFIEDKSVSTMAFSNSQGKKEYTNLGEDMTWLLDHKKDKYFIKPNETAYITKQDAILSYDGTKIDFSTTKPLSPNKLREKYAFVVDNTESAESKIQKINQMLLQQLVTKTKTADKITFKDIGGMDSAIREVKENIVYPMKYPELRNKMSKAILLEGPPGTGKSLLAEAIANETDAAFIPIKGSELDSKFVGQSEENVRKIVQQARENQPTIIFIDEIDAIAKSRSGRDVYGEKVLNTWLAEMSQIEKQGDEVYFIAATNNVSSLDGAMLRAGRFGKIIHIGEPDKQGISQIFDIYRKKTVPLEKTFDTEKMIEEMHKNKATGADIATAFEDARKFAIRRAGIYDKIENGTYTPRDMKSLRIKNEDFEKALTEMKNRKTIQNKKDDITRLQDEIDEYKELNKEKRELVNKLKQQQDFKNRPRIGFLSDLYRKEN